MAVSKVAVLLLVIVASFSKEVQAQQTGITSYMPECNAWDDTIRQMQESLKMIGGTATCAKSADCTGLSCSLTFWGKQMSVDMKLYPCVIPPQMRLMVRSSTINFEQSVTHGDSYALPGFQYIPFPMMPSFKLAAVLVVHFERVTNGMKIGLRIEARGFGTALGWPLMPDTIVPTPPCPTAIVPVNAQCTKLNQLISTMQTPTGFTCKPVDSCHGFSCAGVVGAGSGLLAMLQYDMNATLLVNSCDHPISYTVRLVSKAANLRFEHRFTHSDTVPVNARDLPYGTSANVTVTMKPSLSLDSIDTSIKVDICIAPMVYLNPTAECYSQPLITNQPVPIPPCDAPVTSAGPLLLARSKSPVTGQQAECDAWEQIERGMTQTIIPGYGFDSCHTNLNCMGMTCHAIYENNNYQLYMELFHCANPVTLMVSVDSVEANFHYTQNITEGVTKVNVTDTLSIAVRMTPIPAGGVKLGGNITSKAFAGIPLTIPVIRDTIVPTPSCNGVTGRPGIGWTVNPTLQWATKVHPRPNKPGGNNPNHIAEVTTDDNEAPRKDPLKQNGGVNGMVVGVAIGFAALVTVGVLGSIYYFSRRYAHPRRPDEVVLVGDSGTSVA